MQKKEIKYTGEIIPRLIDWFKLIQFQVNTVFCTTDFKVDRSTMRIFYINISDMKAIKDCIIMAVLMKYFLKGNILSEFCIV